MNALENKTPGLPPGFRAVVLSNGQPSLDHLTTSTFWTADSVAVRLELAGICRSDLKEVAGSRPIRRDFGHELVGVMESSSKSLPLWDGSRVCFDPHASVTRTSGFGEWMIASGQSDQLAHAFPRVPSNLPVEKLLFCEPMACAHHCIANVLKHLRRDSLNGLRILILGAGNAGTLIGLIARHRGANISLTNKSDDRLAFLSNKQVFTSAALLPWRDIPSNSWDVVICATSYLQDTVLQLAERALVENGLMLLFGGTKPGNLLPDTKLDIDIVRRKELFEPMRKKTTNFFVGGTHGAEPSDFDAVIDLLKNHTDQFPVDRLIALEIGLDELPSTLMNWAQDKVRYLGKVVVRLHR